MRELSIEEMEELEDIEIELDKEIELAKNEYNDFYIQTNQGKLIINKKEYSDKYIIDFCKNGFICENPCIRKMFDNKEFTKDELIDFIKNFFKNYNRYLYETVIDENLFLKLSKNKLILKGINLEMENITKAKDIFRDESIIKINKILYLEDLSGILYRLKFFRSYGLSQTGTNTITWGNLNICIIDNKPKKYQFTPKTVISAEYEKKENKTNKEIFIYLFKETMEGLKTEIGTIYCTYDNGNYIYPRGYISEDLNLEIPKKIDKTYFNFNEKELKEILKLKERIPSTEENP